MKSGTRSRIVAVLGICALAALIVGPIVAGAGRGGEGYPRMIGLTGVAGPGPGALAATGRAETARALRR